MKSAHTRPMPHVLGPEGDAALCAAIRRSPLLAFDFDGTLAPIVLSPGLAKVPVTVRNRLQRLRQWFRVAVVSGRSVKDVKARIDFPFDHVIGNHGAEREFSDRADPDRTALDAFKLILGAYAEELVEAGVSVEDKRLSIALHYRLSRDPARARALIESLLPGPSNGLRVFPGKMVVNIVEENAPDKGRALLELVENTGAGCAIYVGDDVNDEPVFAAAPQHWLTVRIGRDNPATKAAFFLDTPAEVALMLDRMVKIKELQESS
jgi:trehalose 6-phosphate phosphatase